MMKGESSSEAFSQKAYKIWRLINSVIIITGITMGWVDANWFDGGGYPISGWAYLFVEPISMLYFDYYELGGISKYFINDFTLITFGVFSLYYVIFNIVAIIKNRNFSRRFKIVTFALCVCLVILLLFPTDPYDYSGYWACSVGVWLSTILEWSPKPQNTQKYSHQKPHEFWRIINMGIIMSGLMMTWKDVAVIPPDRVPNLTSGWDILFTNKLDQLFGGFAVVSHLSAITLRVIDVILVGYIFLNLAGLINCKKYNHILSIFSVALFVSALLLGIYDLGYYFEYAGFWVFFIGALSSFILEWPPKFYAEATIHPS